MLKFELLKILEQFDEDDVIVIGNKETGWTNIDLVEKKDGMISLVPDYMLPFEGE